MKALVTGATGFIGENLVNTLLKLEYKVVCLARSNRKAGRVRAAGAKIIIDDLCRPQNLSQYIHDFDVIFHVAGVTKGANREDYFDGNCLATRNLVQLMDQYAPPHQKLIYISSQAAAGPSTQSNFSESYPEDSPVSAYGESKHAAEKEVLSVADKRPVVILRPSIVFGPGDRALLPLFRSAQWGILPRPGLRDMPVNFIYVQDLVAAMILAAEKTEANNKIFFINDGMEYSWGKWNKVLAECLHSRVISIPIAKGVLYAGCMIGGIFAKISGRTTYLNPDKWNEIKQDGWLCSSERIVKELGFSPRWTLTAGITETVLWYQKEGWLPEKGNVLFARKNRNDKNS